MNVNVVWGPPASGKSTHVRESRSKNSITFDFDMLMREISGLSPHEKNQHLVGYLLDFRKLIIDRLKNEKRLDDAWVIVTWVDEDFRSQFDGLSPDYTLMDTPEDLCLQRVDDNEDRHVAADEMKQVIKDWFVKHEQHYGNRGAKGMEKRALPFEVREVIKDEVQKVVGSGAVYNKRSQDLGGYVEIIRPGCFKRSLESGHEIKSCYNHDDSKTLGSTESEPPLVIRDTPKGVEYEVEIPDTTYGRDLKENLRRKLVRGSSFAFRTTEDNWYKDDKGQVVRELVSAELLELGPVNSPAYLPTEASLRALNEAYESKVSQMQAHDEELKIEREAQARRVREVELLRLQIGGKE